MGKTVGYSNTPHVQGWGAGEGARRAENREEPAAGAAEALQGQEPAADRGAREERSHR